MLRTCTLHSTRIEALVAECLKVVPKCLTLLLVLKLWVMVHSLLNYTGFTIYTPIWDNYHPGAQGAKYFRQLEESWFTRFALLYNATTLKSFQGLKNSLPNQRFYQYLQLKHALNSSELLRWCGVLTLYFILQNTLIPQKVYFQTYMLVFTWQLQSIQQSSHVNHDRSILKSLLLILLSSSQKLAQLFILHGSYFTPQKLLQFGH